MKPDREQKNLKIQVSGITECMRDRIRAMYIDVVQRTATLSCCEFEAAMRQIHILEVRLHNTEGKAT